MTESQTKEQNPLDRMDIPVSVLAICEAYESGYGDGVHHVSKKNPYEVWTHPWYAYAYGVRCGIRKADHE